MNEWNDEVADGEGYVAKETILDQEMRLNTMLKNITIYFVFSQIVQCY